jgi:hypothetical protein
MLFDEFERSDPSPASHVEDHFTFLNRVATPYWERVRNLLSEWVERLPAEERSDSIARMRSTDHRQFLGAFWEVYLWITFELLGLDVTMHPALCGTERRPDFRIETPDGPVYVEATVASTSDSELARDRRRGQIYDTINSGLACPDFWLSLDLKSEGTEAPSITRHLSRIQGWLDEIDPDRVTELLEARAFDSLPTYTVDERGWTLIITALAKGKESRGDSTGRPIAFYPFEGGSFDGRAPVLAALREKAGRYGDLKAPYLIAVMIETFLTGDQDVFPALFGHLQLHVPIDHPEAAFPGLANDGFWRGPNGTQNTGVSAVATARELYEWRIAEKAPEVWHNPWARCALPPILPWRTNTIGEEGAVETGDAQVEPWELFNVPPDWPGPEGPFEV